MDVLVYQMQIDIMAIKPQIEILPKKPLNTGVTVYTPENTNIPSYQELIKICSKTDYYQAAIYFIPGINAISEIEYYSHSGKKIIIPAAEISKKTETIGDAIRIIINSEVVKTGVIKLSTTPATIKVVLYINHRNN